MRIAFAAILALAAIPAVAQMPTTPPGKADAKLAKAGTYKVDTNHTQVLFTVNHLGFTFYTGQFTQPTGTLTLDPANPANDRVEVSFPIAKVATSAPALNEELQKPALFDAAQFPEGKFVSTKVVVKGATATITGNLTLKGVTKSVVLAARFVGAGAMRGKDSVGFTATTSIQRSDFGISYIVPMVSDKVDLTINAGFVAL
ncbi:YceI family protein [soil metagenome]